MISGIVPPETSDPEKNPDFDMIDAQLTTEVFGFYSPGRPDFAVEMAELPIRTTARYNAEWISKFYVSMYSLAANSDPNLSIKENLIFQLSITIISQISPVVSLSYKYWVPSTQIHGTPGK